MRQRKLDALPIFLLSKTFSLFYIVKIEIKAKKEEVIKLKTIDVCKYINVKYSKYIKSISSHFIKPK